MHSSHKLWIMISVFIVIIAFLLSMYFTATPDKVGSVIEKKKAQQAQKEKSAAAEKRYIYEAESPLDKARQERLMSGESREDAPERIKAENPDTVQAD